MTTRKCNNCGKSNDIPDNLESPLYCSNCDKLIYDPLEEGLQSFFPGAQIQYGVPDFMRQFTTKRNKKKK